MSAPAQFYDDYGDNQLTTEKPKPHSTQAEQAVLGGLMLDCEAWQKVAGQLEESDFFHPNHQLIWKGMATLAASGIAFDVVTLAEALERGGWLDNVGGLAYLGSLAKDTPSAANISAYAEIVRERSTLRQCLAMAARVSTLAADPKGLTLEYIVGMVERSAFALKSRVDLRSFGYMLRTVEDLATSPPQSYRVKQVFPETGIAAIFGPSGSGKSFLGFDMARAIGQGADWFGFRVKPGPVVCLVLEGEGGLRNRAAAYRTQHGGNCLANVRFIDSKFDLLTSDIEALVEAIKAAGLYCPTIFVDTLNRAAPGADENSSVDMGRIIAACKRLQAETGGLVVLVHHAGKDVTRGMRGHSSLFAALDAVIQVSRDGERREWTLIKSKDGQDGEAHGFSLKVLNLGEDDDGDPVTSCVVESVGIQCDREQKPKPPTGGNQKIAWSWISAEFNRRTEVPLDEAVKEIGSRLTVANERKPERARESVTGLINRGLLSLMDGVLSSPVFSPNPEPYKYMVSGTGIKKLPEHSPKTGFSGIGEGNENHDLEGRKWDYQKGCWTADEAIS